MDETRKAKLRSRIEQKRQRERQLEQLAAAEARALASERRLYAHERPPDEVSPRAKSTGHRKKTADKWNQ
jgi:hypothetical protein